MKPKQRKAKHFHLSSKDREALTSNLTLLLKASVPIGEALESLKETTSSRLLKKALDQMQQDIDEGMPLWRALERSGIVSEQTLALVQLGEESGNLVENLRVASLQEEKQRIFKAKIRSALMYPGFVLSLTLIVGLGIAWFLLPKLSTTFAQLDLELPLISRIFIGFGEFLRTNGIWAVPSGLSGLFLFLYIFFAAPKTKNIGRRLLFHIPGVGRLLHEVETARFGYLLGTLLQAGLSVPQALGLLQRATAAPQYKKFYSALKHSIEEGVSFRQSLPAYKKGRKLLPPAVQQMVIAGERSGALPETLLSIGEIYESKADISTQNLETILEPILLVIVWLGVLGVAIAVIMPIYGLLGGLQP